MMTLPGRDNSSAQVKQSGMFALSASMKKRSNGPCRSAAIAGNVSSARATRTSTTPPRFARSMFARATVACFGSASSVMTFPPCGRARASQIAQVAYDWLDGVLT